MSKKHNILIIDDEKFVLNALKRVLFSPEYKVHTTVNPHEALEILKNSEIDVLISDQRMPIMNGIKLLRHAKEISPTTKRVLISGFSDHKSPEDFINDGEIVSYVSKPWVDEEVKLLVSSILEMKALENSNKQILQNIKQQNLTLEQSNMVLSSNIQNKRKQIQFVQNIIETSKLQLTTINDFLYVINSASTIKETFTSLFSTIYNILKFEEIGAVFSNDTSSSSNRSFQILSVMKNERTLTRTMYQDHFDNIKSVFNDKEKMIVIQNFKSSRFYDLFKECFATSGTNQAIIMPLYNNDKGIMQFMGFLFLGSREKNFFLSSKIVLFAELLNVLANTIAEMIVFDQIKEGGTQWEETFDAIEDPLVLINKDYNIIRANHAAIKLSGTVIKNLIGKKCHVLFAKGSAPCENCPLKYEGHEGSFFDTSSDRHYKVKSFEIGDNYLVYYKDYTNTQQLYYKLIQSDKMAAIGELAGQVAHEINNPLAGLLAYTQLLLNETDDKSKFANYIPDLKEIESAALRCKDIVENLLSFSNPQKESGFKPIFVNEVIEKTFPLAKYLLKINRINVEKKLDDNLPAVIGNFSQLQQVIFNLVTNACHAMTGGGVLTIETKIVDKKMSVSVQDTGSGIPPASLSKIFAPFYTTKEENIGTGLGLYICHEIITQHSGVIKVDSKLGKGTKFNILLPLNIS